MEFRPSDQRKHTRHAVSAPYTDIVVHRHDPEKPSLRGHTYDVSLSGMRLELDAPLEAGEFVKLEICLPKFHDKPVHVSGRAIRFCDPGEFGPIRMGVMFTHFDSLADYESLAAQLGEDIKQDNKIAA